MLEEYDLTPEEDLERRKTQSGNERATGLQTRAAQAKDRKKMQDFHKMLNTTPEGKKIIQKFRSGDGSIQVLHSITYFGIYTTRNINWDKLFSEWIQKRGVRGRDALSCIAINAPTGEAGMPWCVWDSQGLEHYNIETVLDGCGFILKGYPSYIATTDAMTHTLSALTPSAKKAWKDTSGLVKRVADWAEPIDFNEWAGSDEVVLDNWEIIGIYIGPDGNGIHREAMMKDALELEDQLGLAVYTVKAGGHELGPPRLEEV